MLNDGLKRLTKHLTPIHFSTPTRENFTLSIDLLEVLPPRCSDRKNPTVYPHECRRTGQTYGGSLVVHVRISRNGSDLGLVDVVSEDLPVMVLSAACNLSALPRSDFVKYNEEEKELGGYFIVNGKERLLRLLIMSRRNYPLAIARSSFKKRGASFTEFAIIMRCVREDETSSPLMLHWLMNGEPFLAFTVDREQFFVPISLILRALMDKTELEIYEDIRRGGGTSLFLEEHAMRILLRLQEDDYSSQSRALRTLGKLFRGRMRLPDTYTDYAAGEYLMKEYIAIHVDDFASKYHILCYMIRKLHAFVSGKCCEESNDNLMFQEVLLPGTLYLQVLRSKLLSFLNSTREYVLSRLRKSSASVDIPIIRQGLVRSAPDISAGLAYFLSTGNLPLSARSSLGRQINGQSTGLSVPIDTINFLRFAAQFRAVHRGAAFNDMRTTSVRRLLPEAWGFICPVHTPDGAPCGLLNHLACNTEAVCISPSAELVEKLANWLLEKNLRPVELSRQLTGNTEHRGVFPVILDGRLVGWSPSVEAAEGLATELRHLKLDKSCTQVPSSMEICFIPPTDVGSQFPGLYLFVGGSRLLRPVRSLVRVGGENVEKAEVEMIGTFEQPYLDIAVTNEELLERPLRERKYMEVSPEAIFSFTASLTPYPDFNQSPRNMYQCQMAKQTMGHSSYTWRHRADPKAYRLLTPQSPLVRTKTYVKYDVDHYPLGFNAVVAVMSYTGYDMEDAMVINKSSYERGFAGACIYKSEVIDLASLSSSALHGTKNGKRAADHYFGTPGVLPPGIDIDGFPPIGTRLIPGKSVLYVYTHAETLEVSTVRYKDGEQIAYVEAISLNGSWSRATITLRLPRKPDIGDKYSSRHGQKGINSLLVPAEDMPWTADSGIVPDLIFNPHGFPTRMTMGMMIEFLAGKSAALTGNRVDATPFQWSEEKPPFHEYAEQLTNAGFNYWGTEMMMSGLTGKKLEAHIFIGVVYYQRLRHMVADKYQVRAEGRFDPILRQPIKGRKVGGGVRLGEMERDCLLSHGLSFTLQDRLIGSNCDRVKMLVCSRCGGMLHEGLIQDGAESMEASIRKRGQGLANKERWRCRLCHQPEQTSTEDDGGGQHAVSPDGDSESQDMKQAPVKAGQDVGKLLLVNVPAAFRHLTYELACLNVQTRLTVKEFT
nr:unnamed protein product [Spirometra erinaceieuropaei]